MEESGTDHEAGKSNRRLPKKLKDRVVELYRQRYKGFGINAYSREAV